MKFKRILALIFTVSLSSVFILRATAADTISIASASVLDSSTGVTASASISETELGVSLSAAFSNIGDYAKYEIIVDNPTDQDYEIEKTTDFAGSDYFDYAFEYTNDTNIAKKNSQTTLYVTITYTTEPDATAFDATYSYKEQNLLTINLGNSAGIANPATSDPIVVVLGIMTVTSGILLLTLSKAKHLRVFCLALVVGLALLPFNDTHAIEKIQINFASNIVIEKPTACVFDGLPFDDNLHFFPYVENVTWDEYYAQATPDIQETLTQLWQNHYETKTGILTSQCFLQGGNTIVNSVVDCYLSATHKEPPYTEFEDNYFGFRDIADPVLDSTKVCYLYID